jgi:zinc protease
MTGTKIQVRGESGDDSLSLTVSGDPAALETGLQLAYLLLTDPVIEPAALDQWKTREIQRIAAARLQPRGVLNDAIAEAFYPAGEARLRPLTTEQVRAVTLPAAQGWLDRLITEAPIEVAVVGDVDRATAMRLVARYLGALRARDQISDKTLRALRAVPRPAGPITVSRMVDVQTPQAVVLEGFFGTDVQNVADVRRLAVAARVLSTRMLRTIREERQLVYSIGASSRPAQEYPGFGLFVAQAPTDPAKADALTAAVAAMYADFAKDGPSAEEMEVARKQIVSALDELLKNPDFWLARLATLDYRGLSIDDVLQARSRYEAMTAEEVREAFARYDEPGARFRFAVIPRPQRP